MAASGHVAARETEVDSTSLSSFFLSRGRSIAGVPSETTMLRMLSDGLVILLAAITAILLQNIFVNRLIGPRLEWRLWTNPTLGLYVAFFTLTYLIIAKRYRLYRSTRPGNRGNETYLTAQVTFTAGLLLCGALYMTRRTGDSRFFVTLFVTVATALLYIHHWIQRTCRDRKYARGIGLCNVIIVGTGGMSANLGAQVGRNYRLGFNLCGYLTGSQSRANHAVPANQILGNLRDLSYLARSEFADELLIAEPFATDVIVRLLEEAETLDLNVRAVSGIIPEFQITGGATDLLGNCALVPLHKRGRATFPLLLKRLFDITFSGISLIMLSPLFVVIALAIFIESGRPIFYVSERVGKRGSIFPCFKFRTMVQNADHKKNQLAVLNERDGILFKIANDPRVTRIGRTLRKYSLDELPQFLNVLRGEMSIVGPRPAIAGEVQQYEPEHLKRLEVAPGLTGLWQVEARRDSSFARYVALDIAYIENWSFWLDLTILIRTVGVVLRGTGT
jgi:exopolysaccharide biosynthesis polyprenyl glycosylphosphotransferase